MNPESNESILILHGPDFKTGEIIHYSRFLVKKDEYIFITGEDLVKVAKRHEIFTEDPFKVYSTLDQRADHEDILQAENFKPHVLEINKN